jgi:hypothetical protein
MTWKTEIEKILRDQMPYAFSGHRGVLGGAVTDSAGECDEPEFQEALGYVLDHIENLIEKQAFFDGYACGGWDATYDEILSHLQPHEAKPEYITQQTNASYDKDLSRVGAERAWLKRNSEC